MNELEEHVHRLFVEYGIDPPVSTEDLIKKLVHLCLHIEGKSNEDKPAAVKVVRTAYQKVRDIK